MLDKIHESGLFAVLLPGLKKVPAYRFKVRPPSGEVKIIRDPYSFSPTLGELDLHLFGEGKHEEIYQKLGAHVTKIGRTTGVAFAVWAPHAEGVSVVGDFNGWDGRFNQMRVCWEARVSGSCSFPSLAPGPCTSLRSGRSVACPF